MTTATPPTVGSSFPMIATAVVALGAAWFACSGAVVLAPEAWFVIAALLILQGYFALAPDSRAANA